MRRGRNVDDALYADRVWFTPRRPAWFSCPRPPAPTACRNLGLYCDGSPPLKRRRTFVSADVSAGRRRERETAHPSRPPVLRTEMKNAVTAAFFCVASPKWAAQTAGIRPPSARAIPICKIGLPALQQVRKHAHRRAIPAADSCIIQPHDSWSMPAGARFWAAGAVRERPSGRERSYV